MKIILVDAVGGIVDREGNIFKEMYDLLEEFPNRKIILTGADYEATNQYRLNDAPYEVFTLKHDPEKTDPEYFKKMLVHFGLDKNDVVYFEHGKEAAESANSVGIKTYYYDENKKDLGALKIFWLRICKINLWKLKKKSKTSKKETGGLNPTRAGKSVGRAGFLLRW